MIEYAHQLIFKEVQMAVDENDPKPEKSRIFKIGSKVYDMYDLPPTDCKRWTMLNKQKICEAIIQGFRSIDEILEIYSNFTKDQIEKLLEIYKEGGLLALKVDRGPLKQKPSLKMIKEMVEDPVTYSGLTLSGDGILSDENGKSVRFPRAHATLLRFLMKKEGVIATNGEIMEYLYKEKNLKNSSILKVLVSQIRRKTRDTFGYRLIVNRWGIGYVLRRELN